MEDSMTETSDTNQNEPRFYLSHPIRGAKGDKATEEDMQKNRIAASIFATKLEWECGLNIYCPAEHDEVISILYRKGLIGESSTNVAALLLSEPTSAKEWPTR